jgi:hypothetical protein
MIRTAVGKSVYVAIADEVVNQMSVLICAKFCERNSNSTTSKSPKSFNLIIHTNVVFSFFSVISNPRRIEDVTTSGKRFRFMNYDGLAKSPNNHPKPVYSKK